MTSTIRDRDRALDLRVQIRDYSIALAAVGTVVLAIVAAATLPGRATASAAPAQITSQSPTAGQSTGSAAGALQPPSQAPILGQGGGVVTGGS